MRLNIKDLSFHNLSDAIVDDEKRSEILFKYVNLILAAIAFVMSVVNIISCEYVLMAVTLTFTGLSALNFFLSYSGRIAKRIAYSAFAVEIVCLLVFFIISGIPNGFSAIWVSLVPAFGILIFGGKRGTVLSSVVLLILILLFWTPVGELVHIFPGYTEEYRLRFPFFYIALYAVSMVLEFVRVATNKKFVEIEKKYKFFYRHDALTGICNRYGFNDKVDKILADNKGRRLAVMMVDIDNFKGINDSYGHVTGDDVLRRIAATIKNTVCDHSVYCRWGGEEFLVLMHCDHDPLVVAETLRTVVKDMVMPVEGGTASVTVSIGVAVAKNTEEFNLQDMIRSADNCLYLAKASGKNCVKHVIMSEESCCGCK